MAKSRYRRFRKRRLANIVPQMGLVVLTCLALTTWGEGSQDWNTGMWARPEPTDDPSAVVSLQAGAPHGRRLQTVSDADVADAINNWGNCSDGDGGDGDSSFPAWTISGKAASTVVQILVACFMFMGLAIVCDEFFEPALEAICEAQSLTNDVAGATWMAAGGSAPELATSILGVFVTRSDVGIGTIVGSAVFNVLFVIACCAFVAPDLKLTWWPLARDCSYYCFSMTILVFVICDLEVYHYEAIALLFLYGMYVMVMYYNERLQAAAVERIRIAETKGSSMRQSATAFFENNIFSAVLYACIFVNAAVIVLEFMDDGKRQKKLPCYCGVRIGVDDLDKSLWYWLNVGFNVIFTLEMLGKWYAYTFFGYWRQALNCFDGSLVFLILIEVVLVALSGSAGVGIGIARSLRIMRFMKGARILRVARIVRAFGLHEGSKVQPAGGAVAPEEAQGETKESNVVAATDDSSGKPTGWVEDLAAQVEDDKDAQGKSGEGGDDKEGDDDDDDDDDEPFDPFELPDSILGKALWAFGLPLALAMFVTIPDCRRERFAKWWPVAFSMCIAWIGLLSYFMVWMVAELGKAYGIRDSIMGITLLAMGTSIPDCLSSVAVARRGHGDMAVSSSIGSNIFDILMGLPIPWFIYTCILRPTKGPSYGTEYVPVVSDALAVMILSLFIMVALVVTTIHVSGWTLSIKLGGMMMVLYFCFLALALALEYEMVLGPCDDTVTWAEDGPTV